MSSKFQFHKSIASTLFLLGAFAFLIAAAPQAQAADVYTGTWNNAKYGTKGPVTATLTKGRNNTWTGVFTGTGIGKPFRYNARFRATPRGRSIELRGNTNVGGDMYTWTAVISGNQLVGRYRSRSGNNGQFNGKKK